MESPFNSRDALQSQPCGYWNATPQYAPTPGDFGRSPASSIFSPPSPEHQPHSDKLELVQLSDWEEGRSYDEDPPIHLHYSIEWKVTVNNRVVAKDTEPDLVLAPSAYWSEFLRKKLEDRVQKKTQRSRRVRSEDTAVVVSVNDRSQRDLNKWFEKTHVEWSAVERQLLRWSNLFRIGKKLTVGISFNYVDDDYTTASGNDKRGTRSVTRKMLADRDAQINAESTSGQVPAWEHVYRLMRCPGKPCNLGKWCWQDPVGKKHYSLKTHHLTDLVKYVLDEEGILESHDDVPHRIREQLYAEEQQKLQSRGPMGSAMPTPNGNPININVLPTQPSQAPVFSNSPNAQAPLPPPDKDRLKIRGPRDMAVRAYCEWQESNVVDENLKANFRKARDVAITNGYDLEQVDGEHDRGFFIDFFTQNGVIVGIAQRFVSDIRDWVEECEACS
ncbi:hypothetical protein IFM5058_10396 [Aspergillus udagawae]|nr:hypothetical protein IFM5058_10396 [Aspergillus udagawae]